MPSGTLYLIPATLGNDDVSLAIPQQVMRIAASLDHFIVENAKSARHLLKALGHPLPLREIRFQVLDEHTPPQQLPELIAPLLAGKNVGLLSEAGCPAVADPGAALVRLAHQSGVRVVPLVGPSSILLALMASGLNGQRFAFHGYLPAEARERAKKIAELEKEAKTRGMTQIFIETPYRNRQMLQTLLETCRSDTLLCIAADLTLPSESITTRNIAAWKNAPPDLHKRPAIYLLGAE